MGNNNQQGVTMETTTVSFQYLDEALDHFASTEERRFFVRCLIERLSTEELQQELQFRNTQGAKDPFFP